MFKFLGILVGLYTVYAAVSGEAFAKSGLGGRTVSRAHSPRYFWAVIACYAALALALVFIF